MRVRPQTVDLDTDQRREIARYWDAVNGESWGDYGEAEAPEVERLASYQECWQYVENLIGGYLDDEQIEQAADMAEGAT